MPTTFPYGVIRYYPCKKCPFVVVGGVSIKFLQLQVHSGRGKALQVYAFLRGGGRPPSAADKYKYMMWCVWGGFLHPHPDMSGALTSLGIPVRYMRGLSSPLLEITTG